LKESDPGRAVDDVGETGREDHFESSLLSLVNESDVLAIDDKAMFRVRVASFFAIV
jgi:hypothetical protein